MNRSDVFICTMLICASQVHPAVAFVMCLAAGVCAMAFVYGSHADGEDER